MQGSESQRCPVGKATADPVAGGRRSRLWILPLAVGGGLVVALLVAVIVNRWARDAGPDPFERGVAAYERGDDAALGESLRALESRGSRGPRSALLRGMQQARRGESERALATLAEARAAASTRVPALTVSGSILYRLQRYREAVAVLERAVAADPEAVEAHRWLAATHYDLGSMHEARKHLREVARLAPEDHRCERLRGLILKDYEQLVPATEAYRSALARRPPPEVAIEVRLELAECLVQLKRPGEALRVLAEVPDSATGLALRGEAELGLGRTGAAEEQVERALALEGSHHRARLLAGRLALHARDPRAAVEHLLVARRARPADHEVRLELSKAYRLLDRDDEAEAERRAMERLRDVRTRFSELHEEALARPYDAALRCEIGRLARAIDRPDLARTWYRVALALEPGNTEARTALAELEREGLSPTPRRRGTND